MADTVLLDPSQRVAPPDSAHRRQRATAPRFRCHESLAAGTAQPTAMRGKTPRRSAGTLHSPIKGARPDPELWSSRGWDWFETTTPARDLLHRRCFRDDSDSTGQVNVRGADAVKPPLQSGRRYSGGIHCPATHVPFSPVGRSES
jgi:hypothetical protein